ncbi:MAG: thymidine phosphorylase [Patescibacteria group bacterium]|jgi:AMP phosphorylase
MSLLLRAKKLDFTSDSSPPIVVLREEEGAIFGIQLGDMVELRVGKKRSVARAFFSREKVKRGQVGIFREVWQAFSPMLANGAPIQIDRLSRPPSIQAIKKKLLGNRLKYKEFYSIIRDLVDHRLSTVDITYFVASSFVKEYSDEELYYLTKAIAETGEQVKFGSAIVCDKHSVGGLAGNRTTMIVVPIVAAMGLLIPKTSSRAITSPSGTADTMEVLAPVSFNTKKIKEIVRATKGCLVWGGGLDLAPADDAIIHVSRPISLEPYTKMMVSIMAKKVAMGVTHLVIDLPYGPTTKIPSLKHAVRIGTRFRYLGRKFGIKMKIVMTDSRESVGRGIGPALEARDVLRVLQQKEWRPKDLEDKSIRLAGMIFELVGIAHRGTGSSLARDILVSGKAWKKMQHIIRVQGGRSTIDSEDVTLGAKRHRVHARGAGIVKKVDNHAINDVARVLGAPFDKHGGIFLNKRIGDRCRRGDRLFTLYASNADRIQLALEMLRKVDIYSIR